MLASHSSQAIETEKIKPQAPIKPLITSSTSSTISTKHGQCSKKPLFTLLVNHSVAITSQHLPERSLSTKHGLHQQKSSLKVSALETDGLIQSIKLTSTILSFGQWVLLTAK
jgi:hypothetical protein